MNGKERGIHFFVTEDVSIFRVMRQRIRTILIVCSVIARCMRWGTNAEGISGLRKVGLKTAANAGFRISEKILDILHQNSGKLWK